MIQAVSTEFPDSGLLWSWLWVMVEITTEWANNKKTKHNFLKTKFKEPTRTLYVNKERKKSAQLSDAIGHNVDNLEMILGRTSNIRADDVMQAQKDFGRDLIAAFQ